MSYEKTGGIMQTLHSEGAKIRKAIKFISERRKQNSKLSIGELFKLVDESSLQFDLNPKDEQFLLRFVKNEQSK